MIKGTEFSVKRTVSKSNVSKYKIDNKAATQKEVIEKLSQKGIDLNNNRFLILQGEVEQISMMKPKTGNQDNQGARENFLSTPLPHYQVARHPPTPPQPQLIRSFSR